MPGSRSRGHVCGLREGVTLGLVPLGVLRALSPWPSPERSSRRRYKAQKHRARALRSTEHRSTEHRSTELRSTEHRSTRAKKHRAQKHRHVSLHGWHLAPGPWPLAPRPWSLAPDPWPLPPGPWFRYVIKNIIQPVELARSGRAGSRKLCWLA